MEENTEEGRGGAQMYVCIRAYVCVYQEEKGELEGRKG